MRSKIAATLLIALAVCLSSLTTLHGQSGGGQGKTCDNGFAGCYDYPDCYPQGGTCQDDLGNPFSFARLSTEAQ
jgi:hypothetical protein